MSIYENIKSKCYEKGLSVMSLENELGFSRSSICKWDVNTPGIDKVKKVADILGCTVDDLLKSKEDDEEPNKD